MNWWPFVLNYILIAIKASKVKQNNICALLLKVKNQTKSYSLKV